MKNGRAHPRPGLACGPVDRVATRHKIFEPTVMATANGALRAHILNVSATGALIHAPGAPARGERCSIVLAGREIAADVMWVDGARFGIAFRGALMPDELARVLG